MEAMSYSLPMVMTILSEVGKQVKKRFEDYRDDHALEVVDKETSEEVKFPLIRGPEATRLVSAVDRIRESEKLAPRTFLMALVGQYDAFLTALIGAIIEARPELLEGTQRSLTLSELTQFGTIEESRR